jgi:hypothetical protein
MTYRVVPFFVCLPMLCSNCSKKTVQVNADALLTGLALHTHRTSPPDIAGFQQSIDTGAAFGVNMMAWFDQWVSLEPSPNNYAFTQSPINPLKFLDPTDTKIKSFVYSIKMIETNLKTTPADLQSVSFGDPQMINRFAKLIDTFAKADPAIRKITHILIGNEVDGYLSSHPSEKRGFISFYQAAVNYIHLKLPKVKVGTIITFNGAKSDPSLFNALQTFGDFTCYTYYAEDPAKSPFTMKVPADVLADINWMANNTGGKPFAFTEIGYTSATGNNSSENLQAAFVSAMFDTFKAYKCSPKIEFINYQGMYDYPAGACGSYGQGQGLTDTISICGFMNNLGLKSWNTGQPKPAWNIFKSRLAEFNKIECK